ncbi:MAG: hypothetical protein IJ534_04310 [Bacteroidaceae bacterium]|nr:hypothetical protein [Bacteroidaceae bacterium]
MIKTLSNEFMQKISTDEAWKELSGTYSWSESLLEKYQDRVDWHDVSENPFILWTIPMIQKFKNRIDWDKFSRHARTETLTEAFIDAFKDKWNWTELSENSAMELTHELLEKYADKWNWETIIDCWECNIFDEKGIDFYERYKDYIPASKLQQSMLWKEIVKQQKIQLINEIIA